MLNMKHTHTLTVLRETGEDFPLELELVHGQPRPTEAHGCLQDIDVNRQPNNRSKRVPHSVALVVEVLIMKDWAARARGWMLPFQMVSKGERQLGGCVLHHGSFTAVVPAHLPYSGC